ncbi:hypothetical protein [Roseomonas populi]|uniref:Uncharacterized protein n=1 Tax=Roseomonas populi TaxID=3121582 RepID=A0ABT1XCM2_9PROT|nr:hypothetical protein [Roseomonas pecuniae]MCR0985694.1 hypothetical protein [Roseomonas pecuniae]
MHAIGDEGPGDDIMTPVTEHRPGALPFSDLFDVISTSAVDAGSQALMSGLCALRVERRQDGTPQNGHGADRICSA